MFEQVNVNCYCCQLLLFDTIWWLWLYLFWTERLVKFSDWLVYWVVKETRIRKKENQAFKVKLKSSGSKNFARNAWTGKFKMLISSVAAFWEDRVAMAEEEVTVIISLLIWMWTGHQILISSYNCDRLQLKTSSHNASFITHCFWERKVAVRQGRCHIH